MANLATEIIKDSVAQIMAAMREGKFSREDLEMLKKVFEESAKATEKCLARGPKGVL